MKHSEFHINDLLKQHFKNKNIHKELKINILHEYGPHPALASLPGCLSPTLSDAVWI